LVERRFVDSTELQTLQIYYDLGSSIHQSHQSKSSNPIYSTPIHFFMPRYQTLYEVHSSVFSSFLVFSYVPGSHLSIPSMSLALYYLSPPCSWFSTIYLLPVPGSLLYIPSMSMVLYYLSPPCPWFSTIYPFYVPGSPLSIPLMSLVLYYLSPLCPWFLLSIPSMSLVLYYLSSLCPWFSTIYPLYGYGTLLCPS